MPLCRHSVGTYQENDLTLNWSGHTRPQSSQLAEPLWTDSRLTNGIGAVSYTHLTLPTTRMV